VAATKNFALDRKLGEGGFGAVYQGFLKDQNLKVAIKRVAKGSTQGRKEYISEVNIISRLRHRNLVQLVGWCHEQGELLLMYEFLPNRSLDTHLYNNGKILTWPLWSKITISIASALLYLHEEWEQCVVNCDVKPSNVMLDSAFNAKLGDFGLARLVDHDRGSQTTVLAGTMGYLAPECAMTGKASKESDVYSFGILALEITCGRRPVVAKEDEDKIKLDQWVWDLYGRNEILNAVDGRLDGSFDECEAVCLMVVGLWCAHPDYNS
jgi:serine/threonine protein kinase